jgi:transcriptional regulator of NAD metabolism
MSMTGGVDRGVCRSRTIRTLHGTMATGASEERRAELLRILREADRAITGSELSLTLGVSRQAIVTDVAILRAGGEHIVGSLHGYRMEGAPGGLTAVIDCSHPPDRGREEFEILLDRGIAVLDVGVEHSIFGGIRASILVESRADIDRYTEAILRAGDAPLSVITRGIHSHTVRAPGHDALEAAKRELRSRGILRDG